MTQAFHARISGAVQGVGYRFTTVRHARRLGLTGWVRNLPDGSVEVRAQGGEEALHELKELLAEGPRGAWVREIDIETVDPDPDLCEFEVRW